MDPVAFVSIAIAAVLHAAWNILLKTAGDPLRDRDRWRRGVERDPGPGRRDRLVASSAGRRSRPRLGPSGRVSGVLEVAYFVFLAAAYRRGDLSVVYPLARGRAPLLAVFLGVVVLGERLAPVAWLGVGLLVAGLLVVQRPWRLLGSTTARDDRVAAGFAILTGAMIASYSALDRVGVQLAPAWLYAGILWPVCAIRLVVMAWVRPRAAGGAFAAPDEPLDMPRAIVGGLRRSPRTRSSCSRSAGHRSRSSRRCASRPSC